MLNFLKKPTVVPNSEPETLGPLSENEERDEPHEIYNN